MDVGVLNSGASRASHSRIVSPSQVAASRQQLLEQRNVQTPQWKRRVLARDQLWYWHSLGRTSSRPQRCDRGGLITSQDTRPPVVCQQGPPPPSPIVVERFQQVISQLFQQVQARAQTTICECILLSHLSATMPMTIPAVLQRIVRLGGPVDDDMANLLVAQMLYLDSSGKQDITMYINSPGGSVTAGTAHGASTMFSATCHTLSPAQEFVPPHVHRPALPSSCSMPGKPGSSARSCWNVFMVTH